MKKFLKYLLTYFMGFITAIAVIVGVVFWAYNGITLKTIEGWTGTTIIDESQLDENAEVNVKDMSLGKLIAEIGKISAEGDTVTLNSLVNRYGLKLSDDVKALIPEKAMSLPINKLFTEEEKNAILEGTKVDYLYSIIGQDALPEPLKSVLSDKSLDKVFAGDRDYILDGVKLGYIAGVTYEKQGDNWVAVYEDANAPTLVEVLENVDVTELLNVFNEGGDLLKVMVEDAGEASLNLFIKSISEGDTMLGEDMDISDLYVLNSETQKYELKLDALVSTMKLGHVIGYTPVEENGVIVDWTSGEEEVSNVHEAFANIDLSKIVSGDFDVIDAIGDFYVGELLDYTPIYEGETIVGWLNGEEEVDEVVETFANCKVSELIEGTFNVSEELNDIKIADVLGLTSTDYFVYLDGVQLQIEGNPVVHTVWYDGEEKADGIISALADKTIYELSDGISEYTIGLLAGYVEYEGVWYSLEEGTVSDNTVYVAKTLEGVIKHFVGLSVNSLSGGTAIEDALNGVIIGEALNYVKVGDVWYESYVSESENKPIVGVLKSFVGLKISDLRESKTITDALSEVVIGDEMGYYYEDGTWYTDSSEGKKKVTGILASIAGLTVGDLSNEDKVVEVVNQQSVGEMLGYYYDDENGVWCNNEVEKKPLAGINKTIAEMVVGDLTSAEEKIKDLNFGELMGYHYVEEGGVGKWLDGNNEYHGRIMNILCGKKVSELETTIDGLSIKDVFEETEIEGTVLAWIPSTTPITQINTALKSEVESATIEDYMDLGVLTIEETDEAKLDAFFIGVKWKELTINGFFDKLLEYIDIYA